MNNTQGQPIKRKTMDRRLQAHLGKQLRQLFIESAQEPIPEQFIALLDRLESSAAATEKSPQKQAATSNEVLI